MAQNKFSEIITALRKRRGLSQKEAAEKLNISQALLSHYEKGIRECNLDFLIKVSDFYGVTSDYLLGHSTAKSSRSKSSDRARLYTRSLETLLLMLQQSDDEKLVSEVGNYIKFSLYRAFKLFDEVVDGLSFDGGIYAEEFARSYCEIFYTKAKEEAVNLMDSGLNIAPSNLRYPERLIAEVETELKSNDLL